MMRPLFFEHPDDLNTHELFDQFYFGNHLLVAPIVRPGHRERIVTAFQVLL